MKASAKLASQPKQYTMLNDMVLVKRDAVESKSGDIELPDQYIGLSNKGTVVAVCPLDPALAVGDKVLFSEHAANDVLLDGEEFLLLNRKQIYLKV